MGVRNYKAKSIAEALRRVKADLGSDALILSTRQVPRGVKNPYGCDLFEVSAISAQEAPAAAECDRARAAVLLPGADSPQPEGGAPAVGEMDWLALQSQLVGIREMLGLLNINGGLPDTIMAHPQWLGPYARLVRAGVSAPRVCGAIQLLCEAGAPPDPAGAARRIMAEILKPIRTCAPFAAEAGTPQFAAFVGPTGVGKTTTIAKLAAELSLKAKKRVGLISVDSFRIGAVEQLRTYAAIMGLPCLPAFSHQDLRLAVEKMERQDVVLIDTAGHSHLDGKRMQQLQALLGVPGPITSHLVLSAAANRLDLQEAAARFAVFKPCSYVFTKLDETRQRGAIIDQAETLRLPISYITTGQRVPEDIHPATRQTILRHIFDTPGEAP
ncbi:MAG: flagellar biosynthesis protein FlhF [Desulfobacteraceae bacterium]|jgi:flagellar biosynthesis protein FlhF